MSDAVHLTEEQIQGLADGTLRGPEGLVARDHADECSECAAELEMYGALVHRLATLEAQSHRRYIKSHLPFDALPVWDTVKYIHVGRDGRELDAGVLEHLVQPVDHPCALSDQRLAIPGQIPQPTDRLGRHEAGAHIIPRAQQVSQRLQLGRHVFAAVVPVLEVARLPIALGAFVFCAVILFVLARTLRVVPQPAPASS